MLLVLLVAFVWLISLLLALKLYASQKGVYIVNAPVYKVNGVFTNVNKKSLNLSVCISRHCRHGVNNVNASALNVRGDVSRNLRCAAPTVPITQLRGDGVCNEID